MTREEIIDGLQYTIDMFCFNPSTGEVTGKNRLNDESRLTVDACEGAIEIIKALEQQPCGNAIDRAEAIKVASGYCHPANVAKELAKLPSVNPQPCGDAIDRKLVCAFIAGLISDDGERKKGLEYIRNMPPVNPQPCQEKWIDEDDNRYICKECEYAHKPQEEPCEDAISRQAAIDEAFEVDTKEYGRIEVVGVDAIDALPPVTPQPCEDVISRQAMLDEIRKCRFVVDAIEKIRGLPPVTSQPKTGHWITKIKSDLRGDM